MKDTKALAEREKDAAAEANRTLEEAEAQEIKRRSTTSSCTKTSRRGDSALSEHGGQDGWTSTPCTCGGSSDSGGCDVLARERLPTQRPHLIEGKKNEEETCPTTTKEDEEHPDRSNEKHLGARLPHPGEEAGSVVFHSSSNTSEIRNDSSEKRATASAAAKSERRHVGQRC